jgi:hypothetical protein
MKNDAENGDSTVSVIYASVIHIRGLINIFVDIDCFLIYSIVLFLLSSGNVCYHSVHSILSSRLLSKKLKMRIYKTIILPVVLYWYQTWSLTLREERRLRVFENKVLRRIFGPKRDEVTGGWRKLHNEELRDLYSSPSIIRMIKSRRMRWAGHVARMEKRGTRIGCWRESQKERHH